MDAIITRRGGGGTNATLPPLHTNFTAKGGNATITLSLDPIPAQYSDIYKETIICLKAGSAPTSPSDWDVKVVVQPDGTYAITRR